MRQQGMADEADLGWYLRAGSVLVAITSRVRDVPSPANELIGSLHELTDGEWFWYMDLAHYVERYHVSLDAEFVDYARGRGWPPLRLSEADLVQIAEATIPADAPGSAVSDAEG
ncbi:hypothetical protein ACFYPT_41545 [Streptomyces sp. NPDC005529]|uniref:hypothetical protein n=1 Tax=unclassified Streptomyces TaxID=2593676 RepID=UPI0033B20CC3